VVIKYQPTFYCADCQDEPSGWRIFECRGVGPFASTRDKPYFPCARLQEHGPHSYADRCHCLNTNPVTRAARERMVAAQERREALKAHQKARRRAT